MRRQRPSAIDNAGKSGASSKNGMRIPTSLESAFLLDSPGEYDVHEILVTGVRTYRDERQGEERGFNTCFVYELDGVHVIHLGDVGHLLTEEELGDIGTVEVVCVPVGGSLPAAKARRAGRPARRDAGRADAARWAERRHARSWTASCTR